MAFPPFGRKYLLLIFKHFWLCMRDVEIGSDIGKGRVVVAMSGGVDSSVTAAMMVEAGYDVVGVTLQLYNHGEAVSRPGACCAGRDIGDARRVAAQLGIPYYVLNYEKRFKKAVIENFADSYLRGETPIPCIRCNQTVKFSDLLKTAKELGADAMATGHYVRRIEGECGVNLFRGKDLAKDQSYFLFSTTREQLNYLRFPLGEMKKSKTRNYAAELGLCVSEKPESQDICFIPNRDYAKFIKQLHPEACQGGNIVDLDGRCIGEHDGISHFTIGQRRGLRVSQGSPLYVIDIDPVENRVVVGPLQALLVEKFQVKELNWLGDFEPVDQTIEIQVKVRSTTSPVPAYLQFTSDNTAKIKYKIPQISSAPGQAAVFYQDERVLGGGWIL